MATTLAIQHRCWICEKEVSLESCKTDEKGHMVHEYCYTLRMQLESSSAPGGLHRGFIRAI